MKECRIELIYLHSKTLILTGHILTFLLVSIKKDGIYPIIYMNSTDFKECLNCFEITSLNYFKLDFIPYLSTKNKVSYWKG